VQPTTYETVPELTFAATRSAAVPGFERGPRAMVAYSFLILALCLMIADFYRLNRAPAATTENFSEESGRKAAAPVATGWGAASFAELYSPGLSTASARVPRH